MLKSHRTKRVGRFFKMTVARTLSSNLCHKKTVIEKFNSLFREETFSWSVPRGLMNKRTINKNNYKQPIRSKQNNNEHCY